MKPMKQILISLALTLSATLASAALASTTRYVNGVTGSDSNACLASQAACKTIGHAISLSASGDSIMIAAATYTENITIPGSLNVIGAGASTTIIDGGGAKTVVYVSTVGSMVRISNVTIRNGVSIYGAGISNLGTLTIDRSTISGNVAVTQFPGASGGGIYNHGMLTINNSTLSGNRAGCLSFRCRCPYCGGYYGGGGIDNASGAQLLINNSTLTYNSSVGGYYPHQGGGILNAGILTISNSTVSGNFGNGIAGGATLQNSIVAYNRGGNCAGSVSAMFSLSSDYSCNLNGPGDLNNTDPRLGTLGYYGGPTQTIPLLSGGPAIDAGNPSGCTDAHGNLLKTDQRGLPRPNTEDRSGCDMGAYESQSD